MTSSPEWFTSILTSIGGMGVGGYAMFRFYRRDSNNDAVDCKTQKLIDNMASQLGYERESNQKLGEVIDRLSKERNEAVQNVGRLEGQVTVLQNQVMHLDNEVRKLEEGNALLINEIHSLRREVAEMSRLMAEATIRGNRG